MLVMRWAFFHTRRMRDELDPRAPRGGGHRGEAEDPQAEQGPLVTAKHVEETEVTIYVRVAGHQWQNWAIDRGEGRDDDLGGL